MQQPSEAEFREWQEHPVTEWVFAQVAKFAGQQRARWAGHSWTSGELDPVAFAEARTRADCYMGLAQSSHDDWKAIDDSET